MDADSLSQNGIRITRKDPTNPEEPKRTVEPKKIKPKITKKTKKTAKNMTDLFKMMEDMNKRLTNIDSNNESNQLILMNKLGNVENNRNELSKIIDDINKELKEEHLPKINAEIRNLKTKQKILEDQISTIDTSNVEKSLDNFKTDLMELNLKNSRNEKRTTSTEAAISSITEDLDKREENNENKIKEMVKESENEIEERVKLKILKEIGPDIETAVKKHLTAVSNRLAEQTMTPQNNIQNQLKEFNKVLEENTRPSPSTNDSNHTEATLSIPQAETEKNIDGLDDTKKHDENAKRTTRIQKKADNQNRSSRH